MNAFNWLINLLPKLADLWTWLSTPLIEIGGVVVSPIGVISTTSLAVLLVLALVRGK